MIRSILVLLSFHSDGSLEHDPEGEMKNLPRSLLKYLSHLPWPVTAFSFESLRMRPPPRKCGGCPCRSRILCSSHFGSTGAVGHTTTADPRSQRNRVGRRGGQLLTRAHRSSYGSACPLTCSRASRPGWSHHTPGLKLSRPDEGAPGSSSRLQRDRGAERQAPSGRSRKRALPNDDAAM